jgi:hypothetical protein
METPNRIERPRYTLLKGIITIAVGWAIGIGLMMILRQLWKSPAALAIGQGISFLGFFIGFYWLSEYWRWKRSGNRELFQSRPFRHHLVAAFVGAAALVALTLLMQR